MAISSITIEGYRGFETKTDIPFAIPDGRPGSGLTVMVGPNNGGKSSVIEAIHLFTTTTTSIPEDARNLKNNHTEIRINYDDEREPSILRTRGFNTSLIELTGNINQDDIFTLSSRRNFTSTFSSNYAQGRGSYRGNVMDRDYRTEHGANSNFGTRLLNAFNNKESFDKCLGEVITPVPNWTIDENVNGQYLKLSFSNEVSHSSKGSGDGLINIFNIVDALYDSKDDGVIFIDEPEVSLHPDLQRRLFKLLVKYSASRQIIISTHSPYFIDWNLISDESLLLRLKRGENGTMVYRLQNKTKRNIKRMLKDTHNLHTFSLKTNEVFFLNDYVILVEGQEDVIGYRKIIESTASFFGWGAGGATNIPKILGILEDLGYSKVFTILDGDMKSKVNDWGKKFPKYKIHCIRPTDIRDKKPTDDKRIKEALAEIEPLLESVKNKSKILEAVNKIGKTKEGLFVNLLQEEVKPQYKNDVLELQKDINDYFKEPLPRGAIDDRADKKDSGTIYLDSLKIQQLVSYFDKNTSKMQYANKKYYDLKLRTSNPVIFSKKKIERRKYVVYVRKESSLDEAGSIRVLYRLLIDIEKNNIRLCKIIVEYNSLPVSRLKKKIEAIMH